MTNIKKISGEQLNQVARLLNTTDKNVVFSVVIEVCVEEGHTVREVYDALFGEGEFNNLAADMQKAIIDLHSKKVEHA